MITAEGRVRRTYTTVGTVSAAAALGSLVNLDALDDQVASVETLGVGVGLSVLEEVEEVLGGLDGPASLADTELLACRRRWSVDLFHARSHTEFLAATVPPKNAHKSTQKSTRRAS
jgi:hypothetical protein